MTSDIRIKSWSYDVEFVWEMIYRNKKKQWDISVFTLQHVSWSVTASLCMLAPPADHQWSLTTELSDDL